MRVSILRGLLNSVSMEQYANEITSGLREFGGDVSVDDVRPVLVGCPETECWQRKIGVYVYRYFVYPRRVSKLQSDLYHITDHAHAHLIRKLDPARTIITCHDLMGLVHPNTIHETSSLPFVGAMAFRYSISYLQRAARLVTDSERTKSSVGRSNRWRTDRVSFRLHFDGPNQISVRLNRQHRSATRGPNRCSDS